MTAMIKLPNGIRVRPGDVLTYGNGKIKLSFEDAEVELDPESEAFLDNLFVNLPKDENDYDHLMNLVIPRFWVNDQDKIFHSQSAVDMYNKAYPEDMLTKQDRYYDYDQVVAIMKTFRNDLLK